MNGLLQLNLLYRKNNILLWAKTEIRENSLLSQVNYFWWKASQHFATGMQLYTQNIMHVHRQCSTGGVYPDALPYTSSPQGYLQEIKEKHRFGNGNKPQTNKHLKMSTHKTSWEGKKQLRSVCLSCFQSRKQWGRTAIISPWMGSSTVWSCWQDVAGFSSHICTGTDTQADRPPRTLMVSPFPPLGWDRQTESTMSARLCVLTARSTRSAGCPHCLCSLQDLAKVGPVTGEPSFSVQCWHCC